MSDRYAIVDLEKLEKEIEATAYRGWRTPTDTVNINASLYRFAELTKPFIVRTFNYLPEKAQDERKEK